MLIDFAFLCLSPRLPMTGWVPVGVCMAVWGWGVGVGNEECTARVSAVSPPPS
jgi:hypothetical protein